jgi:hypothetical protein
MTPQRVPSATSAEDYSDTRSEQVYSAIVIAHGASATASFFLTGKGAAIPEIKGSTITAVGLPTHQQTYSDATTNIVQSGQLGGTIGEVSITGLGITIEQANYAINGAQNTYGAGSVEYPEIVNKTSLELKLGTKPQTKGPTFMFPGLGGLFGAVASTGNNLTVAYLTNGMPGQNRELDFPLPVGRNDTLEGVFGVTAPSTSLTFSVTTGIGQPCLVWCGLKVVSVADVR